MKIEYVQTDKLLTPKESLDSIFAAITDAHEQLNELYAAKELDMVEYNETLQEVLEFASQCIMILRREELKYEEK